MENKTTFTAINVNSIGEQVTNALREMLISGQIPPGTQLAEGSLSKQFNVSRTPIREAIKQLESEGLIIIKPRVGSFVAVPSISDSQEIAPIREVLEGLAARICASNPDSILLEKLEQNVESLKNEVNYAQTDSYAVKVQSFHNLLIEGANNQKLYEFHRQIVNKLAYFRRVTLTLSQPGRPQHSIEEHERVLNHIKKQEPEEAERSMRLHVRSSHQEFIKAIQSFTEQENSIIKQ